jgi:hypothetical protein
MPTHRSPNERNDRRSKSVLAGHVEAGELQALHAFFNVFYSK